MAKPCPAFGCAVLHDEMDFAIHHLITTGNVSSVAPGGHCRCLTGQVQLLVGHGRWWVIWLSVAWQSRLHHWLPHAAPAVPDSRASRSAHRVSRGCPVALPSVPGWSAAYACAVACPDSPGSDRVVHRCAPPHQSLATSPECRCRYPRRL